MTRLRVALTLLLLAVAWASPPSARRVITVEPGADLQAILDGAPPHSIITLTSGEYVGPVTIDRTLTLKGPRDAIISASLESDAVVTVSAPQALVEGLTVRGGWTGVDLLSASWTTIRDVVVEGAEAQGIRVYRRPATIEGVVIRGLVDPHAQGIEVLSAPRVVVRASKVIGGKVGIVGHLSTVRFEENSVTGTTQVAVMIREMGSGVATGNKIRAASGAGLYCGDMSRCEFARNDVGLVTAADNTRSGAGWGLVVHYRSTASTTDDVLAGAAGSAVVLADSRMVPSSPVRLGAGATGIIAGAWAALIALAALSACFVVAGRLVPRQGWSAPVRSQLAQVALTILVVGLVVQSFHMVEHWLQLYRVRFDGVPSRGGLAGSFADVEWVHFVYNAAVLGGLGALMVLRKRGWTPSGRLSVGDRLLSAAVLLQGYHLVEHTFKVWQHVATGAKVNPGLVGRHTDLVLLHFGINAAVYLAFVGVCFSYLMRQRATRPTATSLEPSITAPA